MGLWIVRNEFTCSILSDRAAECDSIDNESRVVAAHEISTFVIKLSLSSEPNSGEFGSGGEQCE